MNALESPLEALALDYLTYGFLTAVNNIWAWLAVLTAAASFWRLRASSSIPSAPPKAAAEQPATVSETPNEASAPTKTSCSILEREGSTKMKFRLYYTEEEEEKDDGGESEGVGGGAAVMSRKLGDDWERMMVMRMGDMGWYKWQDRTVLDGSVVRLWEGCRRRQAAALVVDGGVGW